MTFLVLKFLDRLQKKNNFELKLLKLLENDEKTTLEWFFFFFFSFRPQF